MEAEGRGRWWLGRRGCVAGVRMKEGDDGPGRGRLADLVLLAAVGRWMESPSQQCMRSVL